MKRYGLALFTLFTLAATAGLARANTPGQGQVEYELAQHYKGVTGKALDLPKHFEYLKLSAELGNTAAQAELGFLYLNGNSAVPKAPDAAFGWFEKAAAGGSVVSQCMLGDFYKRGLGGVKQDYARAFRWYRKTASTDDRCAPKSQFELYASYASGNGVGKNFGEATRWLKKSAEAGNPVAQATLGRAYRDGLGVERNPELSRRWLRKSREGVAPHDDEDDYEHGHAH
ncbi:Sel1 repeat-containing protein [Cupriavidus agavae]|uniref:Sel1 repeat-containing protein n=2 Tax=Cupriavidus agavae TaxID=1001822 RepID=A0A4Q7RPJ5_9BURK|nr:Sel1 repeat-containing protein [Cupriavidus agavae]